MMEEFYIQDSRTYVGNDMLWWRKGSSGYTTNLEEAGKYSKEETAMITKDRDTDKAWPVEYIDDNAVKVVEILHLSPGMIVDLLA